MKFVYKNLEKHELGMNDISISLKLILKKIKIG